MLSPLVSSSADLPPIYTGGIEIRSLPNRGATAFATRDFAAGDVVLCEGPAVVVTAGHEPSFADAGRAPFVEFAEANGADDDLWAMLRPLSLLAPEALKALRATLYSPLYSPHANGGAENGPSTSAAAAAIPTDSNAMPIVGSEAALCAKLFGGDGALFQRLFPQNSCPNYAYWQSVRDRILEEVDPRAAQEAHKAAALRSSAVFEVLRLLHGCRINFHSHRPSGITCIFPTACKLSHSCAPNTFWAVVAVREGGDDMLRKGGSSSALPSDSSPRAPLRDIRVVHIAERPIACGDELSFSYTGAGLNMLADTGRRRDALHPLGFICRCARCCQYDSGAETCRLLRCLECGASSSVRLRAEDGVWVCGAEVKANAGNGGRDDSKRRQCPLAVTPEAIVDAGLLLEAETVCEQLVMRVMFGQRDDAAQRRLADALFDRAARHPTIGPLLASVFSIQHPLLRRWAVVGAAERLVGAPHYLFAVAVMGLMRALAAAVESPNAVLDFTTFVGERRRHFGGGGGGGSSTFIDFLFDLWLPLAEAWYRANMPLSTQHCSLWQLASSLCGAVAAGRPIPLNAAEVAAAQRLSIPKDVQDSIDRLAPYSAWRSS